MSARSGLVGKNPPDPIWAHLGHFFAWAGKTEKLMSAYFSLVGPWALAAIHPRLGNRYIYDVSKGHCDVFDPCMQNERCMHAWERGRVDFLFGI